MKVKPPMPPKEGSKAAIICKDLMDYNPDKPEATWEDTKALGGDPELSVRGVTMVHVLTTVCYIILSTENLSLNQSKPTV
jgi:hypothetical protein